VPLVGLGPFLIRSLVLSPSPSVVCSVFPLHSFTPPFSCINRRSLTQHKHITLLQPLIPSERSEMKRALLVPFAAFVAPWVAAVTPLSSIDLDAATLPTEYIVELSSSSQLGKLVGEKRTSSVGKRNLVLFLISWG